MIQRRRSKQIVSAETVDDSDKEDASKGVSYLSSLYFSNLRTPPALQDSMQVDDSGGPPPVSAAPVNTEQETFTNNIGQVNHPFLRRRSRSFSAVVRQYFFLCSF